MHFASWYVGDGSFEKDLSEDLLSLGDRGGRREGLEGVLCGGGERRPVGLLEVGVAARSGFGWWSGEPPAEADDDREVVRVESHCGIPSCACGKMGTGEGDIR